MRVMPKILIALFAAPSSAVGRCSKSRPKHKGAAAGAAVLASAAVVSASAAAVASVVLASAAAVASVVLASVAPAGAAASPAPAGAARVLPASVGVAAVLVGPDVQAGPRRVVGRTSRLARAAWWGGRPGSARAAWWGGRPGWRGAAWSGGNPGWRFRRAAWWGAPLAVGAFAAYGSSCLQWDPYVGWVNVCYSSSELRLEWRILVSEQRATRVAPDASTIGVSTTLTASDSRSTAP